MTSDDYASTVRATNVPPTQLPLTSAAEGIYRGQKLDPAYPGYWTAVACEIIGPVDRSRLRDCINATMREATAFHTRFVETADGEAHQIIDQAADWQLEHVDLGEHVDLWAAAEPFMRQWRSTAADVANGPLFRTALFTGGGKALWYLQAHHLVSDGYGYSMLYAQVSRRYRDAMRTRDGFGDLETLLRADQAYQASPERESDREYWLRLLDDATATGFSDTIGFPRAEPLLHRITLPPNALAESGGAWPHRLLAAVAAALHRRRGTQRPVIGLPVSGRTGPAARTPGMVMNIVPIPVDIRAKASVQDLTDQVSATIKASRPHLRYRYEWLRRDLGLSPSRQRLFAPVVNVIPFFDPPQIPGCEVRLHPITAGPVDDLSITAHGPHALTMEANPDCYRPEDLPGIAEDIITMLTQRSTPVGQWRELAATPAPKTVTMTERLDRHVATAPDAVALIDGQQRLTYRDLQQRAEEVAGALIEQGARPGELVALDLPRGAEAIVAILAVHYAGLAYVPLDPGASPERRDAIIASAVPRMRLSSPLPTGTPQRAPARAENDAYVIFTSGSTGDPKGVRVSHAARDFFVSSALERYGFSAQDRVLQFAPLHFDAHVEEVFVTLAAGGCLVLRDESATESLRAFMEFVHRNSISILDLPTAYWHELTLALHTGQISLPPTVHTVIIGGEAAATERLAQWHAVIGSQVRLINTYGPTEATVVCVAADLRPHEPLRLGTPLPGVAAAVGPGNELYIAGPGLASGYLGTTASLSVPVAGRQWYRTGDVVTVHEDQTLSYVGRSDDEVKISGHRVHPLEVESVLLRHPDVAEAAVLVDQTTAPLRLVAFVSGDIDAEALHDHARAHLVEAARPSHVVRLDRIPRTSSGKLDYRSLAIPAGPSDIEAATATEQIVIDIFTAVLGAAPPRRDADFFHHGGSSLKAVAVASRLSAKLGRDITASTVFAAPTIAGLAAQIDGDATGEEWDLATDTAWKPIDIRAPQGTSIAVTGGTGFVGSWLIAHLLRTTDRHIHCLGRGTRKRLESAVLAAGADPSQLGRLHILESQLDRDDLGLDATGRAMFTQVGTIIHCAAEVSLGRGYSSLRRVNTLAVGQLLRIAAESGTAFHHVSTVALGVGRELPEDFVPHHDGLTDGYQHSKWAAEELLRQAGESGLSVACYRLGRVVPPSGTDVTNSGDLVSQIDAVGQAMGSLPDLPIREPWIEVDVAARNIAALAMRGARGVWNLTVGEPVDLSTRWKEMAARIGAEFLPMPLWRERLEANDSAQAQALHAFFAQHQAPSVPAEPTIHNDRFAEWLKSESNSSPLTPTSP
ncbi:AMP-binding protein [Natronoglycomyces albus]|uniref:AMP-binding protein n=1 Tax=Natronoglycomyces albus TaxID=2811108 RepID=A0A895XNB9_9ACTN|nr:AMP-binding protein [Natronoglycomyces albus]QSB03976.1 AMP-binding protein [Natronoglycomyces albus]